MKAPLTVPPHLGLLPFKVSIFEKENTEWQTRSLRVVLYDIKGCTEEVVAAAD